MQTTSLLQRTILAGTLVLCALLFGLIARKVALNTGAPATQVGLPAVLAPILSPPVSHVLQLGG